MRINVKDNLFYQHFIDSDYLKPILQFSKLGEDLIIHPITRRVSRLTMDPRLQHTIYAINNSKAR